MTPKGCAVRGASRKPHPRGSFCCPPPFNSSSPFLSSFCGSALCGVLPHPGCSRVAVGRMSKLQSGPAGVRNSHRGQGVRGFCQSALADIYRVHLSPPVFIREGGGSGGAPCGQTATVRAAFWKRGRLCDPGRDPRKERGHLPDRRGLSPPPPLMASATALLPGCSSVCRKGLAVLPWNLFRTRTLCPFGHSIGRERPWMHTGCLSPLLFLSISRSWSISCLHGSRVPHGLSRRQEQVEVAVAQEHQRGSWRWGLRSARCLLPTPQVLLRGSLARVASGSPLDQPPKELPGVLEALAGHGPPPPTAIAWSPAASSLSVSPAIPAREAAGPDPAARGRQGIEGEPGPPGGHRV